jgi:SAM-dependent methyltransferase
MDPFAARAVGHGYDTVAADYADAFADDLKRLPIDRAVLDAAMTRFARGPILDIGCGPGQVGEYLAGTGALVLGVDLAPEMLRVAKGRGTRTLVCADMRALPIGAGRCAGAVAFYSIQHLPRTDLGCLCDELHRVLAPGGTLVVAAHLGHGEIYSTEFLGHTLEPVGGTLYGDTELRQALSAHSFVIDDATYRDPLPHEHQSRRIYLTTTVV